MTQWLKLGLSLEQGDSTFRKHLDTLDNTISAPDDNNAKCETWHRGKTRLRVWIVIAWAVFCSSPASASTRLITP